MKVSNNEYSRMVKNATPNSNLLSDCIRAFIAGGLICVAGQLICDGFLAAGLKKDDASALTGAVLILAGALLTGIGVYDKMASLGKAGTLVPITGFANSIVSPAMEYKTEGLVPGVGTKMFTIAGPVIVYGISASVIYGFVYKLLGGM